MINELELGDRYEEASIDKLNFPVNVLEKLAAWSKNRKHICYFSGTPGVGKTYFCAAIAKLVRSEKNPIYYMNERQYFNRLRQTMKREWDDYETEIKKIGQYPFVILDDLGSSQMTDWQKEVLFSFLDYRSQNSSPTLITSNLFLDDLKTTFCPRFLSRIKDKKNTIIELNWTDKRQHD